MTNSRLKSFIVFSFSIWWGWTVLTDFFVVPSVFRNIPDFFQAGDLGITLFKKLNYLEFPLSILILALGFRKFPKPLVIISAVLVLITATYLFYLTPQIELLTELWKEADRAGVSAVNGIADIQQEHQKFHRLYVSIDSVKLLLLTSVLGYLIFKREPKHA